MSLVSLLSGAIVLYVLFKFLKQWYRKIFTLDNLVGYWPVPVLGFNALRFWRHRDSLQRAQFEDTEALGLFHHAWIFHDPFVVVNKPDLLKQLLVSPSSWQKYDRASNERVPMRVFLGDRGLLMIQNGDEWHAKRSMLAPAFSRSALKHAHTTIIKQRVRITCELLQKQQQQQQQQQQNKCIDMQEVFQRLTFDIASLFSLGIDVDSQRKQASSPFYAAWKTCIEYTFWHVILYFSIFFYFCSLPTPWRKRFEQSKNVLEKCVYDALENNSSEKEEEEFPPLITILQRNNVERTEIRDELMTFLFAGHDTTTSLLSWTLYFLCTNHDWLERARAEIETAIIASGCGDASALSFESLQALPVLRAILKETLRLYPPVTIRQRTLVEDDEIGGHRLRADTHVTFSPWTIHRSPLIWENAEKFDPSRFLNESTSNTTNSSLPQYNSNNVYAYVPFGQGPRRCIGEPLALLEGVCTFSALISKFDFELDSHAEIIEKNTLTLSMKNGLPVRFRLRK